MNASETWTKDLDTYRKRFKRQWANNNRLKQSLELMGLTIDDAIEIELFVRFVGKRQTNYTLTITTIAATE